MAAMLVAIARLAEERPAGMPTVIISCSVNEEYGFGGVAALAELWTDHSGEGYGYGFGIQEGPNGKVVGHGGGFPGINSNLDIMPDRGYIVAVMSNYGRAAGPIAGRISELIAEVPWEGQ